jgi:DNA-binding transcriptional MerR regulator
MIFFPPEIKNYFSGGKMNLQEKEITQSEKLLINELAKISNTEITTLEFYAKINLLHFTQRRRKARRIFDKNINLYILDRVQLMKQQGLSLDQIKLLIKSMKESYIKKHMKLKEVNKN